MAQSRKNLRPQSSDDETVLAVDRVYTWYPEYSHPSIINITTDISSAAITTIPVNREDVQKL